MDSTTANAKQIAKRYLPRWAIIFAKKIITPIKFASDRYDVITAQNHCLKSGEAYKTIDSNRRTTAIAPHFYNFPVPAQQKAVSMPDTYWATIKQASVIGGSNIVLTKQDAIYNAPIGSNINYSDNALYIYHDSTYPYQIGPNTRIYWKRRPVRRRLDQGISLICNYSFNYYHFVLECLPKLHLIEQQTIPPETPILVDACVTHTPSFRTYLDVLMTIKRPIIYVGPRERIDVDTLYLPSAVNVIIPNMISLALCSPSDNLFDMQSIRNIREKMLLYSQSHLSNRTFASRIFISRKNHPHRSYNEPGIWQVLQKHGFERVMPETLSLAEQIQTFAHADWIIAASGAALTNILYCHPGCRVLVLTSLQINLSIFSSIADALDIRMIYLTGEATMQQDLHTGFQIDPGMIESCLDLANQNK